MRMCNLRRLKNLIQSTGRMAAIPAVCAIMTSLAWGGPAFVEPDEAARDNGSVKISSGWTTRYTPRTSTGDQEYDAKNCNMTPPNYHARPDIYYQNDYSSSGMGYGVDGGDTGAEEWLEFTTSADTRSVSALFLNHTDGQIVDVLIDGTKVRSIDTFATGGKPSYSARGVIGQILEEVIATDLSPEPHTIRLVNTGKVSNTGAYEGRMDRGMGRQVILDCFRTGTFEFGTIEGVVTDSAGKPIPHMRMTVGTEIGPIVEGGKTIIYTNGDGKYRLSGLTRGQAYSLASDDRRANFAETVTVPSANGGLLVKNFAVTNVVNITRPRMMAPAIVARGAQMQIEVDAPASATSWSAKVMNDDIAVELPIVSSTYTTKGILNGASDGWVITTRIPDAGITMEGKGAPCELLYDLELTSSIGSRIEEHSVSVIEDYNKSFYFAQITDAHITGGTVNLQKNLKALAILSPRFIAMTGDLVNLNGQPQLYNEFLEIVKSEAAVPAIATNGNHDVNLTSVPYRHLNWNNLFAQSQFAFSMGPVYVMTHSLDSPAAEWSAPEWNRAYSDPNHKAFLLFQHTINKFEPFVPPAGKPATIAMGGHNHNDTCKMMNGTPVVTTRASTAGNLARIVRLNMSESGDWSLKSFAYPNKTVTEGAAADEYPSFPLYEAATGQPTVSRTYGKANDGKASENSVTFTNKSLEAFETCRARFHMAKGAYQIKSGNGRIIDSYKAKDGTTIVLAEIPVPAKGSATLAIHPKNQTQASRAWVAQD